MILVSYDTFMRRMTAGGTTVRLEHIENGRRLLEYAFADDPSYIADGCPVWYSDRVIYPRIYGHSFKTSLPDTAEIQTLIDDPFYVGDIIPWGKDNGYWMVTSSKNLHDLNWEGTLEECNSYLKFKSKVDGSIREYPIPIYNATQYGSGETNEYISIAKRREKMVTIGAQAHVFYLPIDKHTISLDNGSRFLLDLNRYFPTAYRLTQIDTTTNNTNAMGGMLRIYIVEDSLNRKTDDTENMVADMWEDPVGNNSEVHDPTNNSWI